MYINKIWIGNPENQVVVDGENLSKFDFQFLDAIRDVERDMFSGKNTLLKNVIDFLAAAGIVFGTLATLLALFLKRRCFE